MAAWNWLKKNHVSLITSIVKTDIIDAMNDSFHSTNATAAGRRARFWHGLQAGCLGVLRLFDRSSGMLFDLEVSLQKRELEEKLLAAGYSRRLALIAVSVAFSPTANPE